MKASSIRFCIHFGIILLLCVVTMLWGSRTALCGPKLALTPATAAQERTAILRLNKVMDAMYGARDAEGMLALYAPGYVVTDQDGSKITLTQMSTALRQQCAHDKAIQRQPGRVLQAIMRTTPTHITVNGTHATVQWSGRAEALSLDGGAWGHIVQASTGEDDLARTPRGWRFVSGRVFSSGQKESGGLTPEAALAVQKVFQAKRLLDQEIAGEQASDDQQQQLRIEQNQHDEQVWREKHGY